MTTPATNRELVEAIWDDRLADLDHPQSGATCRAIGAAVGADTEAAIAALRANGIDAEVVGDPSAPAQRREAQLRVATADEGLRAADVLAELGYESWDPVDGAARPVHRRFRSTLTMARTTDATMRITLGWKDATGWAGRLPAAVVPGAKDFDVVELPPRLWPLYLGVRPMRLVAERLGLRRAGERRLGPFLGTPDELIGPLLDLARVTPEDTVVDLGCGDGRVVVEAAAAIGCRAVGVEGNATLVELARRRAADAGPAGELVSIIEGDAADMDAVAGLGSVYFLFVPAPVVGSLVTDLLARTAPGTRIVVHEQQRLVDAPPGATTTAVLTDRAATVAHCWTVSSD